MTDRELYNHIKANYKPEKGTALFFDLRNYHLCGLQPRVLTSGLEMEFYCFENAGKNLALIEHFEDDIILDFTYREVEIMENIKTGEVFYYRKIRKYDQEQLKKEFAELASFLKNSKAS